MLFVRALVPVIFLLTPLGTRPADLTFNRDIRPILADKCFACHGNDQKHREADRRLDTAEGAFAEKDGVIAIRPRDLAKSEVWTRITSDDREEMMPPPKSHKTLSAAEKELIRKWIEQGAVYQKHWAFEPVVRPVLPTGVAPAKAIDALLGARLAREGLAFSPAAEKETLLRRVSLDLTGIPPTLEEIAAFTADKSTEAYEKVVDRLLASPRYGEHLAVWWCDAARYGDSNGYQNDFLRDQWRWRDWVIEAFNRNEPFDQFTIEQIGGDLLPAPTLDQRIATGFHRNHRTVTESGAISEEWRAEYVIDRVSTTGQVWLGLTLGCARCHDHKFDPVSQKEFYQLAAFFNSIAEQGLVSERPGNVPPLIKTPTREQQAKLAQLDAALTTAQAAAKATDAQVAAEQAAWARSLAAEPAEVANGLIWRAPLAGALDPTGASVAKPGKLIWSGGGELKWDASPFGPSLRATSKEGGHVEIPDSPEVDGTKPFSAAAWVKIDDAKQTGAVLSRMNEGDAYRGFDVILSEGKPTFHLIHHWTDNAVKVTAGDALVSGRWQHVAVTYDGSRKAAGVALYIDGKAQKLTVNSDTLTGTTQTAEPLRLGLRTKSLPLAGELRDVRWYGRALAAAEVVPLAEAPYLALARTVAAQRSPGATQALDAWFRATRSTVAKGALAAEEAAGKAKKTFEDSLPTTMVMAELPKPRPTFILKRGAYNQPGEQVALGTPASLPPLPAGAPVNRLGLGQWLVAKENPLTARVIANRLWERFFGVGIVKSSGDFGLQGEAPVHPELLDWLASELQQPTALPKVGDQPAAAWDLKAFQKLLVTSAAYRQSSAASPALLERDPENRLLARGPRFRLPAETIRDQALAVSGLLVEKLGGPSVKPYQPPGVWEEIIMTGVKEYKADTGEGLHRRTLYTFVRRTAQQPSLAVFDAPNREYCVTTRERTNTPLQALAVWNDVTYLEAARQLAELMLQNGGGTDAERLAYGFKRATARSPRAEELAILQRGLAARLATYRQNPKDAESLLGARDKKPGEPDPAEWAAYTTAASVILNSDEMLTHQ